MAATRSRRRRRHRPHATVHKPTGTFHPRVQAIGPDHFGIVAVDCAKARCKWLLADFYGNVLIPPTTLPVSRPDLDAALDLLRRTAAQHQLRDLVVAVERTGRYHHPVLHAFRAAGYDARVVHPFATKQLRQPADPGNKTDDTDLAAIHRAAVNGFALCEAPRDEFWTGLQLLIRHRRDLVWKISTLY